MRKNTPFARFRRKPFMNRVRKFFSLFFYMELGRKERFPRIIPQLSSASSVTALGAAP